MNIAERGLKRKRYLVCIVAKGMFEEVYMTSMMVAMMCGNVHYDVTEGNMGGGGGGGGE